MPGQYAKTAYKATGTSEQLHEILSRSYAQPGAFCPDCGVTAEADLPLGWRNTGLPADLLAWRDAAIARALAEAGAVHPQVHTSARIVNYLEQHGWRRIESPRPPEHQAFWSPPDPDRIRWVHPSGIELDAPLSDDAPGYAEIVRVVVNRIAWAATGQIVAPASAVTEVLREIAQQPDEVAW